MPDWTVPPLLVMANLGLGWLILAHFRYRHRPARGDLLEWLFAALGLGTVVNGWLALLLAELGLFAVGRLAVIWLALALLLVLAGHRRNLSWRPWGVTGERRPRAEWVILAVWLVAASWLFFRPHEYVLGGSDAGVYVSLSAAIAGQGGILIQDMTLAALDPALYPALLRPLPPPEAAPYYILPGFYVTGSTPGLITPQFYPLHPVWQAVAYGLGGPTAALLMPGLWALLGCLAIYLVVRHFAGWPLAALALAALSLNALQVWFARYPTTETLTQYLLWLGVWSLGAWLTNRRPLALWGLLAGLSWGQLFLTRIDTYFLLAIPLLIGLALWGRGRWQRAHVWLFLPLALLTVHSFVHALWQSSPYFFNIFGYGLALLRRAWLIPLLSLLLLASFTAASRYRGGRRYLERWQQPLKVAAILLLVLLAGYGWFIRPAGALAVTSVDWYGAQLIDSYDQENLLRLGWYLTPLGVWLAVAGAGLMTWQLNRRLAVVLVVGVGFSLLYLWRIQANPHQIYTMRRYVPAVMPFFIIAAVYAIGWLQQRRQLLWRWSAIALALVWLAGLGYSARGFISQVDFQGVSGQLDALNERLEPNSVLLFYDQAPIGAGDLLGTPLQFIYGHTALTIRRPEALDDSLFLHTLRRWQQEGRTIYWVGSTAWLDEREIGYVPDWLHLHTSSLEHSYTRKPTGLVPTQWELTLARLTAD
jgi:4-amino-4-deoxy-L-arabinose transferase-like glycosyltransferase